MPVTVTPLGSVYVEGDYSSASIGGTVNIGSGPGEVFACVTCWIENLVFTGGVIDGTSWEIVAQNNDLEGGVSVAILRASPSGTGTVSFTVTGNSAMGVLTAFFFRADGVEAGTLSSAGRHVNGATVSVSIDTVEDGFTLAVCSYWDGAPSFTGFTNDRRGDADWAQNVSGYRSDSTTGSGTVQITSAGSAYNMVAASFAPGDAPGPVVFDLPVVNYALTIPAPTLLRHRVFALPAVNYGLSVPAPTLLRHRVFDLPAVSYGLSIPAPILTRGRVFDLPAVTYGLTVPAPSLLRHQEFTLPVVEYGLTIPTAEIVRGRTFDLPLVSYGLSIPAPSVIRHQVFDLPVVEFGVTIPAPEIVRGRVFDLPLVEYGLTIPAMEVDRGSVFDLPLVSYAISIPAPSLLRHRIIDLPVVSYGLTIPALVVVLPGSSTVRLAYPGDSANGGLFTIRAPGALVSDGITGGTIERG